MSVTTPLALWQELLAPGSRRLLEEAALADPESPAAVTRLRCRWKPDLVHVAFELTRARQRAARKFPDPERLVANVAGVEQATSHLVAEHKAMRFAALAPEGIVDLCCGIGGDAMSLTRIALTEAYDIDPVQAWMTASNAGCETRVANVEELSFRDRVFHCDPARREANGSGATRRFWRWEDYRPGPAFHERLLRESPHGAIKLGPGVRFEDLPRTDRSEIEVIGEHGTLVQAVLWSGDLAHHPGERCATRLPAGSQFWGRPGAEIESSNGEFHRHLHEADPALERAGLLGAFAREQGLVEVFPGLGLLTAQQGATGPWTTSFEVLDAIPWRLRRVKQWLKAHDGGVVEIKTRGGAVDPDRVRRELRGDGSEPFTVFVVRLGTPIRAIMTRRSVAPD